VSQAGPGPANGRWEPAGAWGRGGAVGGGAEGRRWGGPGDVLCSTITIVGGKGGGGRGELGALWRR
jgi:hypothetical protein